MVAKSKKIEISELDFDDIKANFIEYLSGQEQFQDYDFTGSNLNILLDILAYNTHFNQIYNNLAINEVFLDSASKRSSVVSRAKDFGYITKSASAAKAVVDIRVTNTTTTPDNLVLPKYTTINTFIDGDQYSFYTTEEYSTPITDSQYLFEDIEIKEGTPLAFNYTVNNFSTYVIPNPNVDLSTLKVRVKETSSSLESDSYTLATSITDVTNESLVYFIKEIDGELYEIEFGDGILGKALDNGNIVSIEYIVTNKALANNAKTFTYQGSPLLGGIVSVTTKVPAFGGSDIEDIESVRFSSPKSFAAQNRGVTPPDIASIVKSAYPNSTISVWGGEDNDPPVYGKVFICIKPDGAPFLTFEQKEQIKREVLKNKKVLTIVPEIIDPTYIDVEITSAVYFNPQQTSRSAFDIASLVTEVIQDYNTDNLEKFGVGYRDSRLSTLIDTSEKSIISNVTTVTLHVPLVPSYNISARYEVNLGNPIRNNIDEQNIVSTGFTIFGSQDTHYIEDTGTGILRLYKLGVNDVKNIVSSSIGTVNYATGQIVIPSLRITTIQEDFKLIIKPESYDVMTVRNQIVRIPDDLINVSVIIDSISIGNSQAGTNFTHTSSRS